MRGPRGSEVRTCSGEGKIFEAEPVGAKAGSYAGNARSSDFVLRSVPECKILPRTANMK